MAALAYSTNSPAAAEKKTGEGIGVSASAPGFDLFIRLSRQPNNPKQPASLDTSIVRYSGNGITVDLIGAIHVGDKRYYQKLNREFEQYQALLYEMVAPKDDEMGPPEKWKKQYGEKDSPNVDRKSADIGNEDTGPSNGPAFEAGMTAISGLQQGMKNMLGLDFQLEWIDYSAPNMVHADMSPEEFSKTMAKRGETFFTIFAQLFSQAWKQQKNQQGAVNDLGLLLAFLSSDRELAMKRVLARQFVETGALTALESENGSTIITERNKIAMKILREQILDEGKKKLGVFYGAGHLVDMSLRLERDFGLKRQFVRWLEAWDLRVNPAKAPASRPKTVSP